MTTRITTGSQWNNLLMLGTGLKCHVMRTTQEAQQILQFTSRFPQLYNFCEVTAFYTVANIAHELNTHTAGLFDIFSAEMCTEEWALE